MSLYATYIACKTPSGDFTLCGYRGSCRDSVPNRNQCCVPCTLPSAVVLFLFCRHVFTCKHYQRSAGSFMCQRYKHLSGFDIIHLGAFFFPLQGRKKHSWKVYYLFTEKGIWNLFLVQRKFYLASCSPVECPWHCSELGTRSHGSGA